MLCVSGFCRKRFFEKHLRLPCHGFGFFPYLHVLPAVVLPRSVLPESRTFLSRKYFQDKNMIFLQTFAIILIVAALPIVLYALSKCGKDFDFFSWLIAGRTRLSLGFALILLISLLISFVPEAAEVLSALGFNVTKPWAIGIAIGGLLVSGVRGDKDA